MTISSARQRNAVSEGMALGLVMHGRWSLPFDKLAVDLAFESAWRRWLFTGQFPQVDTDLRKGTDPVWVITHTDEQKHVLRLYWGEPGRELAIHARPIVATSDVDADEIAELIDGDVPASGWHELATAFLERFERDRQ
ncbi:hypothetical protein LO763_22500 [Glycomyces sp. A-F 0318]|uniref:hypothetical protein n=1 Tax=Glycomyces amatae TaxID=2881355 RepID=UPI001E542150|nr:hypothetical protein [Glycomyces amatae]MCD0446390.1 hypothetical protein [Glycomyces amatae]